MCLANLVCEHTDSVHRWLLCSVSASAWNSRRALFPTSRAEGIDGNLQSYNLILLDVLPLCVSETVVTCLVCVSSVNTQTFSVFYSTNRHFTGEQTMRSAPRLREQFPPSGHSFIYFHSFIVFSSFSYFSLFCSFFVYLWLFCGPLWFSLDNWLSWRNKYTLPCLCHLKDHTYLRRRGSLQNHIYIFCVWAAALFIQHSRVWLA